MNATGVMELTKEIIPESRAQIRKRRKDAKREMKPMKIGLKKAENAKVRKISKNIRSTRNQRAGRQINQARLTNH